MPPTHEPVDVLVAPAAAPLPARFIYIACPWAPAGGGMYKVADYLIQSQAAHPPTHAALLRPLDTRGAAGPVLSLAVLMGALARIAWGRWHGGLAGVHVNMGERMSLFRKGVVVATCRLLGVPVLLHLHARMDGFYRRLPAPLQRLTRRVFLMASAVVVIGPAAREFVLDVLRVPPSRVEVIINGVPESTAPPVPDRIAPGPCRVLFLGNLSERKGLVDLLFALAQPGLDTPSLDVTIAGGGDVARFRRMAAELGVGGMVRFEGWCDQAKTRQLLARSHVLALPSHDEVLPLAVLEALAHGVAVLTTPVGEIPSLLTDGVDAMFVPPGDPPAIAEALQRLMSDPVLIRALARNGRLLYQAHFSLAGFFTRVATVHRRHFGVAAQLGQPAADAGAGPPQVPN